MMQAVFASPATAEAVPGLLPSRPIATSPPDGSREVTLQLYRHPPGAVRAPALRHHVVVLNMAGKVLIDDTSEGRRRQVWAGAGHFSLTPAGQPFRRSWQGSPEVLLVYLKPSLVRTVALDLDLDPARVSLVPRLGMPDRVLHQFGLLLRAEAANPGRGSALLIDSIARALVVHLMRRHASRPPPDPVRAPGLPSRRLARVTDFMSGHIDEPLSLPQLAKLCGLSATHFARAFRQTVGKPPHAFLIDLRLEKACELLEHTSLSITEIAFSCGFEQSQYFATLFRRKLGCTPSSWRNARGAAGGPASSVGGRA